MHESRGLPMRIAVLRCGKLPSFVTWEIPDFDGLFTDDRLLIDGFASRGHSAESVVWSDPGMDWNRFDAAIIRSTWDYVDERERFLSVLAEIEASSCRLFNPLNVVKWNSHKSYLFDLERWQVPIVPTRMASPRDAAVLQDMALREGHQRVILKPIVGVGAADIRLIIADGIAATLAELAELFPAHDWLLQPLIESVISEGEWSFIYFAGEFSHALLKRPATGDYRAHGIYGGTVEFAAPRKDDLLQAESMLAKLPFDPLYARLDLVRLEGRLVVMELELIEPMLYFDQARLGAGRLVGAALSRMGQAPS